MGLSIALLAFVYCIPLCSAVTLRRQNTLESTINEGIQLFAGPGNVTVMTGSSVSFCCVWTSSYDLPLWRINGKLFPSLYLPDNYKYDKTEGLQLLSVDPQSDGNTYSCGFYYLVNDQLFLAESPVGTLHVDNDIADDSKRIMSCQQFQPPVQPTTTSSGHINVLFIWQAILSALFCILSF